MALVLFDTNILIDALKNYAPAIEELAHWDDPTISAVTWMEVYAGANVTDLPKLDNFMDEFGFTIIPIDTSIMTAAASLCSERRRLGPKIGLPDAIIQATANIMGLTVITRNKKDFKGTNVRIPYELETVSTVRIVNLDPPGDTPTPNRRDKPTLTHRS